MLNFDQRSSSASFVAKSRFGDFLHLPYLIALYVDPGSGSMVLQLLLGGVSGIYVFFRLFKQKILGFFGIRTEAAQSAQAVPAIPSKEDHARRQA